jgi:hypothetical protein
LATHRIASASSMLPDRLMTIFAKTRRKLVGLADLFVSLLAVTARLALVFPGCLCLYDYFDGLRVCLNFTGVMNISDLALCPLGALVLSFRSVAGPYRDHNGEFLPHYLPIFLIALVIAVIWARVDHRRYGKGWG